MLVVVMGRGASGVRRWWDDWCDVGSLGNVWESLVQGSPSMRRPLREALSCFAACMSPVGRAPCFSNGTALLTEGGRLTSNAGSAPSPNLKRGSALSSHQHRTHRSYSLSNAPCAQKD